MKAAHEDGLRSPVRCGWCVMRESGIWSLSFGQFGGVQVRLHLFFCLFAALGLLLAWIAASQEGAPLDTPLLLIAGVAIGILLSSVLLHELGHLYVARALGGGAYYWDAPGSGVATNAAGADMSSAPGDQPAAAANDPGVDTVLRSMFNQTSSFGGLSQFYLKRVGSGTDYESALRRANEQLSGFDSRDPSIVYFLSDGQPTNGRTDGPRAPNIIGCCHGSVVFAFTVCLANRVNRWQIQHIEAHLGDVGQTRLTVLEGTVLTRHCGARAREHFIPCAVTRLGDVDYHG